VANTHLSFVPGWNGAQLRRVARAVRSLPAPRVLLGDLNLPGPVARAAAAAAGWRSLARAATYPAPSPRVQLDHVLWHPRRAPAVTGVGTPPLAISDHRPLTVSIDLR
jgi:endonuclease/exonuclease/phosphatase family metal-dependent hydrolase